MIKSAQLIVPNSFLVTVGCLAHTSKQQTRMSMPFDIGKNPILQLDLLINSRKLHILDLQNCIGEGLCKTEIENLPRIVKPNITNKDEVCSMAKCTNSCIAW
uniref:Uncharacterized protein n=1 Tax=Romanomermis culicivorax TaxID=13658 RepID=A0A915K950_ROMCU